MTPQHGALEVLHFWFGTRPYTAAQIQQHSRLWFGETTEVRLQTDELIRERFAALTRQAADGALASWGSGPRRRLGLILLLDQFPRNIYRGSPQAFAQDRRALELALDGIQGGGDATLDPVERIFFYMPLMHVESVDIQEEGVAAFSRLKDEAPPDMQSLFDASLRSAVEHRDLIARFQRFPHRNRILKRESTADEQRWLAAEGHDFGQ